MNKPTKDKNGFTIVETLVSIAVLVTLFAISIPVFHNLTVNEEVTQASEIIISALRQAQKKTIASENEGRWGVYLATSTDPDQATIFFGNTYASRDPNFDETYQLPDNAVIGLISPFNMREIIFERITGAASSSANIRLELTDDPAEYSTIYLDQSGQISLFSFAAPNDNERFKDARHVHFTYSREIATDTESIILNFDNGAQIESLPIVDNMIDENFYKKIEIDVGGVEQRLTIKTMRLNSPDTLFCVLRDRRYNNVKLQIDIDGDIMATPNLLEISADGLSTATGTSLLVSGPLWQ